MVADDVTLLKRSLDVCGSANLILMDGACLSIHAPDYFAALAVRAGSALTVYGRHLVNPYLGNPSLRFFDETDVTWIPDGEVMRSGVIADRGRTALSALAEGEGTLSFCWKVSSEAFCDKLHVLLDGKEVCDWISGTDMEEWRNVTFRVDGKGEHTVTWSYTKDGGTSRGSDCGWIDIDPPTDKAFYRVEVSVQ